MTKDFLANAKLRYLKANTATLRWMLARRKLAPWLDTKVHPLSGSDFTEADLWRGPSYLYGWIQGRGLEALALHGSYFAKHDPSISQAALSGARDLETALSALVRRDGGAFFTYSGLDWRPVRPGDAGQAISQTRESGIATFADIFAWKGLLAARATLGLGETGAADENLAEIGRRIETGQFQIDERIAINQDALARQANEYGPRMIFLGAASLAATLLGPKSATAGFAGRVVSRVFAEHLRKDGLIADIPDGQRCNPGHAIEFVGFALECRHEGIVDVSADAVADILLATWRIGGGRRGIALYVEIPSGKQLSPYYPWWAAAEAIRAAALAYEATGRSDMLELWREAHELFFGQFWQENAGYAYQTLTDEGPVDFVPATPDLDPGYHTGLSLLCAIKAIERLGM